MAEQLTQQVVDELNEKVKFCVEHPATLSGEEARELNLSTLMVAQYAALKGFTDVDTAFAELVPELQDKGMKPFYLEELPSVYEYLKAEAWREDAELKQQVDFIEKVAEKKLEPELQKLSHRFSYDFELRDVRDRSRPNLADEFFFSEETNELDDLTAREIAFMGVHSEKFRKSGLDDSAMDIIITAAEEYPTNQQELIALNAALKSAGLTAKDIYDLGSLHSGEWVREPFYLLNEFLNDDVTIMKVLLDKAAEEGRNPAFELYFQLGHYARERAYWNIEGWEEPTVYSSDERNFRDSLAKDLFMSTPIIQRAIKASDLKPDDAYSLPVEILETLLQPPAASI